MGLWIVATVVFILNMPFGFWRSRVRKFSWPWILSIHLPVPMIIALRVYSGIGWHLISFPILIGAFLCGQFTGGRAGYFLSPEKNTES